MPHYFPLFYRESTNTQVFSITIPSHFCRADENGPLRKKLDLLRSSRIFRFFFRPPKIFRTRKNFRPNFFRTTFFFDRKNFRSNFFSRSTCFFDRIFFRPTKKISTKKISDSKKISATFFFSVNFFFRPNFFSSPSIFRKCYLKISTLHQQIRAIVRACPHGSNLVFFAQDFFLGKI